MEIPQSTNPPHIFVFLFLISIFLNPWPHTTAQISITTASNDYGNMINHIPSSVLYPSSPKEIIDRVISNVTTLAIRGHGHSVRGQAMSNGGTVVDLNGLRQMGPRIQIGKDSSGFYADVGAEQLWVDVLKFSQSQGLAPVSFTDYLYLTVGGTLSNAGISGQAFLHGPQIVNVKQLEVITGKGEFVNCSRNENPKLFFAVLGGLGQFGIITRARIVLDKAPTRAKWARLVYSNFSAFTQDQEHLISLGNASNYVEGLLILNGNSTEQWRPDFSVSQYDQNRIVELLRNQKILYAIELAVYYDNQTANTIDQKFQTLVEKLNFIPGLNFSTDVALFDFLHRVGNLDTPDKGSLMAHPWLNLFVPKSHILEFNNLVLAEMLPRLSNSSGVFILYPLNKDKWDDDMSAVTPEGDVFYAVGFLHSSPLDEYPNIDDFNAQVLSACESGGIEVKQYLPHYSNQQDWIKHFGRRNWAKFKNLKTMFDPRNILAPGQTIFNSFPKI